MMRRVLTGLGALALGGAALAETGRSDFVFLSDLLLRGFTPVPVASAGNASLAVMQGTDLYLCFIADDATNAAARQKTIIAELNGETPDREVANIPVVCVLTQ